MSADNYLLVVRDGLDGCEVHHLFASDEEPDINTRPPMFTGSRLDALQFAHKWASENVCEYGVVVDSEVWEIA
jgi:hypothetical protein